MKVITHSDKAESYVLVGTELEIHDLQVVGEFKYGWVDSKNGNIKSYIVVGLPCAHLNDDFWEIVPENPFEYWNKLKMSREVGL